MFLLGRVKVGIFVISLVMLPKSVWGLMCSRTNWSTLTNNVQHLLLECNVFNSETKQ